tara:strand:- start:106 stop:702 length:597 start_codon:yes stop_codon:yes gene_type:complete
MTFLAKGIKSMNFYSNFSNKKSLLKKLFLPIFLLYLPFQIYSSQALEFQWDTNENYKKLKYHQINPKKNSRNKIFLFYRPSDRKTGLLSIDIKIPKNFKSTLKPKNISLCKVKIGGFDSRTKCLENIPSDIEINREDKKVEIYPISPVPSNKDSYAIVFKLNNPKRSGLYQFHSFGKSSGPIPVGKYLGSWTIRIDQL